MKWQAMVVMAWIFLEIGWAMAKDGQPKMPYSGIATFISLTMLLALLWGGGFFDGDKP